jgi:hypothetical protein
MLALAKDARILSAGIAIPSADSDSSFAPKAFIAFRRKVTLYWSRERFYFSGSTAIRPMRRSATKISRRAREQPSHARETAFRPPAENYDPLE